MPGRPLGLDPRTHQDRGNGAEDDQGQGEQDRRGHHQDQARPRERESAKVSFPSIVVAVAMPETQPAPLPKVFTVSLLVTRRSAAIFAFTLTTHLAARV